MNGDDKMKAIAILLPLLVLLAACRKDVHSSGNAEEKQNRAFIAVKPQQSDVVGSYVLTDQTVIKGGYSALQGRQCQLDLRPDGSFSITNYPNWREMVSASSSNFNTFISTEGRWTLCSVGTTYDYGPNPKNCWGMRFSESDDKIDPMTLTGEVSSYGLITILGDPDSNTVIVFKKKGPAPK